jgi:hypothetical protein
MERDLYFTPFFEVTAQVYFVGKTRYLADFVTTLRTIDRIEASSLVKVVGLPKIHDGAFGIQFSAEPDTISTVVVAFQGSKLVLIAVYDKALASIPAADHSAIVGDIEEAIRAFDAFPKHIRDLP